MAKVLADQGNLKKAAEIYAYLLAKEPGRQDLAAALAEIRQLRRAGGGDELRRLFETWLELLLGYSRLKQLKGLKKHLK